MTAKRIHAFKSEGEAVDVESVYRLRTWMENEVIAGMRERGYVPVLDIVPTLYTDYDADTTKFRWQITVQGVFVGQKKAKKYEGMYGGELIGKNELCTGTTTCSLEEHQHTDSSGDVQ